MSHWALSGLLAASTRSPPHEQLVAGMVQVLGHPSIVEGCQGPSSSYNSAGTRDPPYEPLLIGVGHVLGACEHDVAGIREVGGAYLASASLHGPPAPWSSLLPVLAVSPHSVVPFVHRSSPSCSSFRQNPIDGA